MAQRNAWARQKERQEQANLRAVTTTTQQGATMTVATTVGTVDPATGAVVRFGLWGVTPWGEFRYAGEG